MRELLKAISFETLSTAATLLLSWWYFGDFNSCLIFNLIAFVLKLALYCVHERLWK
jgi:uncharacterized membrane protein